MKIHYPVLLNDSIDGLNIDPDGIYVDATFGRGGHSKEILNRLGPTGNLVAIDRDPDAVKYASFINDSRLQICHDKFSNLSSILKKKQITKINGLLLDLGVSSPQLADENRGFSFLKDGPLDMRMDTTTGKTLSTWLEKADVMEIQNVLSDFGEERFSKSIAIAVCKKRDKELLIKKEGIKTTTELADVINKIYISKGKRKQLLKHPATKSFQAFRIFINDEIDELILLMKKIPKLMKKNGRISVISFHSIEDRIVKKFMKPPQKGVSRLDQMTPKQYAFFSSINIRDNNSSPRIQQIKKVFPSEDEIRINKRSRSAILRVGELICENENCKIRNEKQTI